MSVNYDDIDFCLNTLYDFVYSKPIECYEFKYESKSNVDPILLKKPSSYNFSKIFSEQIEFESFMDNKIILKRTSKSGYPCLIRVSVANDHKVMLDSHLNYIFSDLAINDVYKYILLPIMNFDVTFADLEKEYIDLSEVIGENFSNIKNTDTLHFQIFERYSETETLRSYLDKNADSFGKSHWKVLCFQILYALYKLQKTYPSFRHNKLNLNSIYVVHTKDSEEMIDVKIGDLLFYIPNRGFEIKITNFYDSTIKGISKENRQENSYYDVFSIFNDLLNYSKKDNIDVFNFLNEIVPENFRPKNKNTIELDEAYYQSSVVTILNPFIILSKNNFFIEFIKEDMNRMSSPLSNKKEDLSSFQSEENSYEYLLSSSLTESGYGTAPSMLAKHKNYKSNTVSGTRKLAVHPNKYNLSGGKKKKSFDEYGEMDEDDNEHKKKKEESTSEDSEETDNETEESEDEESEDEESEDEEDDSEELTDDEEPATEKPPSESGANMFFNMVNNKKLPHTKRKNNGLFDTIEKIGNRKRAEKAKMNEGSMAEPKKTKKSKNKKNKGKKQKRVLEGNLQNAVLSKLPQNYEGLLPDWLQSIIPGQNEMQHQGMPHQGMQQGMPHQGMMYPEMGGIEIPGMSSQMPGMPNTMSPQMPNMQPTMSPQMPPQMMPPQMPPQMMPPQMMPPQMMAHQMPPQMMAHQMPPQEMMPPQMPNIPPSAISAQDHTTLLPPNLLMNQQAKLSGGKKSNRSKKEDNFFF